MTRRVGVFVALFALLATASAQTADETTPAPAKKKPAATAKKKKTAEPAPEPPPVEEPAEHEPTPEEIEAALPPHITGPKLVDLGNNIEIDLPAGMILFERAEAKKLLEESGDHAENVNAMIGQIGAEWTVVVEYEDVGYVKDTDADQLDAQELFNQYQAGTLEQNKRRKTLGIPELFLDGWSEMPKYNRLMRHLVWGLKAHTESGQVINHFTRILGRNGYMSVDLIDAPERLDAAKAATAPLYASTRFKAGYKYEDHQDGDKDSGIGLRALVLGGTGLAVMKVAKTGLLIKLLLVFKKAWWVLFAAIGGFFKLILGRKKNDDDAPPPDDDANV